LTNILLTASLLCVFAVDILGCPKFFKLDLEFEKILQTCVSKNASKDSQTLPLHEEREVLLIFHVDFSYYSFFFPTLLFFENMFKKNCIQILLNFAHGEAKVLSILSHTCVLF